MQTSCRCGHFLGCTRRTRLNGGSAGRRRAQPGRSRAGGAGRCRSRPRCSGRRRPLPGGSSASGVLHRRRVRLRPSAGGSNAGGVALHHRRRPVVWPSCQMQTGGLDGVLGLRSVSRCGVSLR